MTQIGSLRDRVEILTYTEVAGDIGQITQTWGVATTVYAKVKPKAPNYRFEADHKTNEKRYDIIIRGNNTNLDENNRLRWDGKYMFIDGFSEMENTDRFVVINARSSEKATVSV